MRESVVGKLLISRAELFVKRLQGAILVQLNPLKEENDDCSAVSFTIITIEATAQ